MWRWLTHVLIPYLPTERLIQALGNLEGRDSLRWLRAETQAELDRLGPVAREAFSGALGESVLRAVLQRAVREQPNRLESQQLLAFVRAHPLVALGGALKGWLLTKKVKPWPICC